MRLNRVKLINARSGKGLTQKDVAKKARLSIVTVNRAEKGEDVFNTTASKLAAFYELDLEDLMVPLKEGNHGSNGDAA